MFIIPLLLTWTVSVFISAEIWWGKQLIMKNVPPVSKADTEMRVLAVGCLCHLPLWLSEEPLQGGGVTLEKQTAITHLKQHK